MLTVPNILSLMRLPLAAAFMQENVWLRGFAIILAMASDGLDGYLARRFRMASKLGRLLDPITDKFFVLFAIGVLLSEGRMQLWQSVAMLSRDIALFIFGGYLLLTNRWGSYEFRAIWWGKLTTTLQFFIFLAITFSLPVANSIYLLFIFMGIMALFELRMRICSTES